ncbi:4Fe-4S binding protein [Natranaerofaba carboxydovora]|uniref:4Fe-4S binding protein n=1 Tax=Natranaerofaba carboxydovora TaxID=2742683 RepID=UPI001F145A0A|nr:4Fe-4S binding protein [Natranaerofaba carboxydovora]UMZ75009.1 Putative electron transport protein YccM [Natranaerofaba carboxydovora]
MTQKIRLATQLFMVFLAAALLVTGIYGFNILFILSSFVLALFFGRVFCGWLCPLGFWSERVLEKIKDKTDMPMILTGSVFRVIFTILFILGFITVRSIGIIDRVYFPFLLMGTMFVFATIFGLLFFGRSWCGYLCPWGNIGAVLAKPSKVQLGIGEDCVGCKKCAKACPIDRVPSDSVDERKENKILKPFSTRCIRCLKCSEACPKDAIDIITKTEEKYN